jgi:hypothetical protein
MTIINGSDNKKIETESGTDVPDENVLLLFLNLIYAN